jgi:putative ABC transport system substrate-binding protein
VAKRVGLLHDLVPKAVRIAVLVNPANAPIADATLRDISEAARALGLQTQVVNASTSREIESAFTTLVRDRADALFVAPDSLFGSRRVQLATLAARYAIPTACSVREQVEAGGLMSYGTDLVDAFRQKIRCREWAGEGRWLKSRKSVSPERILGARAFDRDAARWLVERNKL